MSPEYMADDLTYLLNATPAKTPLGVQEVQTRSLRLGVMPRRVLILVDGRKTGRELSEFVAGSDICILLDELLGLGCIAVSELAPSVASNSAVVPAVSSAQAPVVSQADLAGLPDPLTRSAKELEMARNFMTNTVNTIFGHHNRITLIESIFACRSSEELRRVYPSWAQAMESNATGKKRLPELREKLFAVL